MPRSIVVRVDEALVEEARRAMGMDGLPARVVVEEALRRVSGGRGEQPRLAAIDEGVARLSRLVAELVERLERLEERLEEALAARQGVEQHAPAGPEKQKRGIRGFCGEKPYDVVDLRRVKNPERFLEAARRRGLRVLHDEGADVAVLVCPGVTAERLLEEAARDERLAEALRELGYVYEPEPGRLEWVEEPRL